MVPSLVHGVNKTRKHWHCCIFQIVFSIPIYPLQRVFLSPQNLSYTPKFEKSSILLYNGRTKKRTQQIYPQFQNAVGILILTAVLSLNFQASQNREKKTYLYTGPQDPTTIWCSSAQNVSIGSIQSAKISNWKRASWNIQELLDVLNVDQNENLHVATE